MITMVAALVTCSRVSAQDARLAFPSEARRFVPRPSSMQELPRFVSAPAATKIQSLARLHKCPVGNVSVYRKGGAQLVVVRVPCQPAEGEEVKDLTLLEYPLTFVVRKHEASRVDFSNHGFMYQSGAITAVTDANGDGSPEFWLSGAVCECDGEPEDYGPEGCQCDGGSVVEFRAGALHVLRPQARTNE